jgi:hypothetical protein
VGRWLSRIRSESIVWKVSHKLKPKSKRHVRERERERERKQILSLLSFGGN